MLGVFDWVLEEKKNHLDFCKISLELSKQVFVWNLFYL